MSALRISAGAAIDLEEIWDYIAADNIEMADAFMGRFRDLMESLARTPGMGHRRRDLVGDRALLFFPLEDYLIIYRRLADFIEIVAVAHAKRNVPVMIRDRKR